MVSNRSTHLKHHSYSSKHQIKKSDHYRTWKSGKKWVYASTAVAFFIAGATLTLNVHADLVTGTPVSVTAGSATSDQTVGSSNSSSSLLAASSNAGSISSQTTSIANSNSVTSQTVFSMANSDAVSSVTSSDSAASQVTSSVISSVADSASSLASSVNDSSTSSNASLSTSSNSSASYLWTSPTGSTSNSQPALNSVVTVDSLSVSATAISSAATATSSLTTASDLALSMTSILSQANSLQGIITSVSASESALISANPSGAEVQDAALSALSDHAGQELNSLNQTSAALSDAADPAILLSSATTTLTNLQSEASLAVSMGIADASGIASSAYSLANSALTTLSLSSGTTATVDAYGDLIIAAPDAASYQAALTQIQAQGLTSNFRSIVDPTPATTTYTYTDLLTGAALTPSSTQAQLTGNVGEIGIIPAAPTVTGYGAYKITYNGTAVAPGQSVVLTAGGALSYDYGTIIHPTISYVDASGASLQSTLNLNAPAGATANFGLPAVLKDSAGVTLELTSVTMNGTALSVANLANPTISPTLVNGANDIVATYGQVAPANTGIFYVTQSSPAATRGSISVSSPVQLTGNVGDTVVVPAAPTAAGYTNSQITYNGATVAAGSNITLTYQGNLSYFYAPSTVTSPAITTIKYQDINGNPLTPTTPITVTGNVGDVVTVPTAPTITGYVFGNVISTLTGVTYNGSLLSPYNPNITLTTAGTLTYTYAPLTSYTVNYVDSTGAPLGSETVTKNVQGTPIYVGEQVPIGFGGAGTLPAASIPASVNGLTFSSLKDSTGTLLNPDLPVTLKGNDVFTAVYGPGAVSTTPANISVSYVDQNGLPVTPSNPVTVTGAVGSLYTLPTTPVVAPNMAETAVYYNGVQVPNTANIALTATGSLQFVLEPQVNPGTTIYSGVGRYQVLTLGGQALGVGGSMNVSIPAGDTVVAAYMGFQSEQIDGAVPSTSMVIDTPTGPATVSANQNLLAGVGKTYTSGMAGQAGPNGGIVQYADVTAQLQTSGSGTYRIDPNYLINSMGSRSAILTGSFLYVIVSNPNYDYNAVNISNFNATDYGASAVTGATTVNAPSGYLIPAGSSVSVTTQATTIDAGDSLTLSVNNNPVINVTGASAKSYQIVTGNYTTTGQQNSYNFGLNYSNSSVSAPETLAMLVTQVAVTPVQAIYHYVDQNGNPIGTGLSVGSGWTDPGNVAVPEVVGDSSSPLSLIGVPGQTIPDLPAQIPGYTLTSTTITPSPAAGAVNVFQSNSNTDITYSYTPSPQTVTVQYLDDTTGQVVTTPPAADLSATGVTAGAINIPIWNYAAAGYTFVSAAETSPAAGAGSLSTVTASSTVLTGTYTSTETTVNGVLDPTTETNQTFVIHLTHALIPVTPSTPGIPATPTSPGTPIIPGGTTPNYPAGVDAQTLTETLNRTINYVYANGTTAAASVTQPVTYTRTAIVDAVTGQLLGYNTTGLVGDTTISTTNPTAAWTPATQTVAAVTSPSITGYTPDTAIVGALALPATAPDSNVTVTYAADPQTVHVNLVDTSGNPVSNTNNLNTYTLTGTSNSPVDFTPVNDKLVNGYVLKTDSTTTPLTYDNVDGIDQSVNLVYTPIGGYVITPPNGTAGKPITYPNDPSNPAGVLTPNTGIVPYVPGYTPVGPNGTTLTPAVPGDPTQGYLPPATPTDPTVNTPISYTNDPQTVLVNLVDTKGNPVTNTNGIKTYTLTGTTGSSVDFTPVNDRLVNGYILTSDATTTPLTYDNNDSTNQTVNIVYTPLGGYVITPPNGTAGNPLTYPNDPANPSGALTPSTPIVPYVPGYTPVGPDGTPLTPAVPGNPALGYLPPTLPTDPTLNTPIIYKADPVIPAPTGTGDTKTVPVNTPVTLTNSLTLTPGTTISYSSVVGPSSIQLTVNSDGTANFPGTASPGSYSFTVTYVQSDGQKVVVVDTVIVTSTVNVADGMISKPTTPHSSQTPARVSSAVTNRTLPAAMAVTQSTPLEGKTPTQKTLPETGERSNSVLLLGGVIFLGGATILAYAANDRRKKI